MYNTFINWPALKSVNLQIEEEREQFRVNGLQQEHNHQSLLRDIDEQQKETECQAEDYENQANVMSKILDEIKIGLARFFYKSGIS